MHKMATPSINPPTLPGPRPPAPRPITSRPRTSRPQPQPQPPSQQPQAAHPQPNAVTNRRPAGPAPNGAGRLGARIPSDRAAPTGVAGQPHAGGARHARVMRPPSRSDADSSQDHALASTRQLLFKFTQPVDGLPPPRTAETVAILQDLMELLRTYDDKSLAELADNALREEIKRHR